MNWCSDPIRVEKRAHIEASLDRTSRVAFLVEQFPDYFIYRPHMTRVTNEYSNIPTNYYSLCRTDTQPGIFICFISRVSGFITSCSDFNFLNYCYYWKYCTLGEKKTRKNFFDYFEACIIATLTSKKQKTLGKNLAENVKEKFSIDCFSFSAEQVHLDEYFLEMRHFQVVFSADKKIWIKRVPFKNIRNRKVRYRALFWSISEY